MFVKNSEGKIPRRLRCIWDDNTKQVLKEIVCGLVHMTQEYSVMNLQVIAVIIKMIPDISKNNEIPSSLFYDKKLCPCVKLFQVMKN